MQMNTGQRKLASLIWEGLEGSIQRHLNQFQQPIFQLITALDNEQNNVSLARS